MFSMQTIINFLSICLLCLVLLTTQIRARPGGTMDELYDEVANFFDTVNLDDVANAGRNTVPEDFCRMPARKGVCRALIPRWSYDVTKKDCVEFKFGGCDGNENNFASYKSCMDVCRGM